jgi:hypothetical protein
MTPILCSMWISACATLLPCCPSVNWGTESNLQISSKHFALNTVNIFFSLLFLQILTQLQHLEHTLPAGMQLSTLTIYLQAALLSVTMLPTPVGKHESLYPTVYSVNPLEVIVAINVYNEALFTHCSLTHSQVRLKDWPRQMPFGSVRRSASFNTSFPRAV